MSTEFSGVYLRFSVTHLVHPGMSKFLAGTDPQFPKATYNPVCLLSSLGFKSRQEIWSKKGHWSRSTGTVVNIKLPSLLQKNRKQKRIFWSKEMCTAFKTKAKRQADAIMKKCLLQGVVGGVASAVLHPDLTLCLINELVYSPALPKWLISDIHVCVLSILWSGESGTTFFFPLSHWHS